MTVQLITNMNEYYGLSTDTKPASPLRGSTFLETDTKRKYIYSDGSWVVQIQNEFDVSIYPVSVLLATDGVQYNTVVTNATTGYVDALSIGTDTYFPDIAGKLAWAYANISFEVLGDAKLPIIVYKVEAKNSTGTSWVIQSAEETYQTTTGYVGKRLEGYLAQTTGTIDSAPFDIRLQFLRSTATSGTVSVRLKNDTIIRSVGSR